MSRSAATAWPQRAHDADHLVAGKPERAVLHVQRRVEVDRSRTQLDANQPRSCSANLGGAVECRPLCEERDADAPRDNHALSASPRSAGVLWAGTDDGNIQVTLNGGATWKNVTPADMQPWTRIFNIEAGHFDTLTAYAAANTLRIDDMRPHFWRTRNGGRTWTEINTGIASNAVANSIREDPRVRGLLYAATDAQVWVSFDDGANWQSLRLNMPAISVRDIQVKTTAPVCVPI